MIKTLSEEAQDACAPSKEQVEEYLAEPDDAIAALLSLEEKQLVAKCILYGRNIAQEQLKDAVRQATELPNPFVGYVDVVENIRMAKEQGFERYRQELRILAGEG